MMCRDYLTSSLLVVVAVVATVTAVEVAVAVTTRNLVTT